MGYIGNALNPKRPQKREAPLFQRKQWDYCDRCYYVCQQSGGTKKLCKPKASTSYGPLQFCVLCGWRYLVFKAAMITSFPEMHVESLTDNQMCWLRERDRWLHFVIEEDMGMIMSAWASFDESVRDAVDNVDRRPLKEQLRVTIGARNTEASHA